MKNTIALALIIVTSIFSSNSNSQNKNLENKKNRLVLHERAVSRTSGLGCYEITSFEKEDSGLIKLNFLFEKHMSSSCPDNVIYNVTTKPKEKIRGSSGVNGKIADKNFSIQVLPDVTDIALEIRKDGKVEIEWFNVEKEIKNLFKLIEAENSIPAWQLALNNTESKLAEKSKQDKTPPSILIESP